MLRDAVRKLGERLTRCTASQETIFIVPEELLDRGAILPADIPLEELRTRIVCGVRMFRVGIDVDAGLHRYSGAKESVGQTTRSAKKIDRRDRAGI